MGIWKQRIEGTWVRCSGESSFNIVSINAAPLQRGAVAMSLKHRSIDGISGAQSLTSYGNLSDFGQPLPSNSTLEGFIYQNAVPEISCIVDYYFGPSITSTTKFLAKKTYQFKTHVLNFANIKTAGYSPASGSSITGTPDHTVRQQNGNVYYSSMNIFTGALGINPSWEDIHYFHAPYYKGFGNNGPGFYNTQNPKTPSTYTLYYYSSPKSDIESGYVAFHNKLKPSIESGKKAGTQSVYQAGYGITGIEVNETGWKMQGYSFASYDNKPDLGDPSIGLTSSLSYYENGVPVRTPIKYCTLGKGWYYDEDNNEYTWHDRQFDDIEMDSTNNPVGGDSGFQNSTEGYRENNYIAKYIPFQKFNLSFLYECLRSDAGIKIYLSPTLPTSKSVESSKYNGLLIYPSKYTSGSSTSYRYALAKGVKFTLVSSSTQMNDPLPGINGTYSFAKGENIYTPNMVPVPYNYGGTFNFFGITFNSSSVTQTEHDSYKLDTVPGAATSSIIVDYPSQPLVNHILVEDESTNLKEIRVNITLRHTYLADLIINLRAPNGNVINIKAKYSGEFFNDLRNITFTTNSEGLTMQDYTNYKGVKADWWPGFNGGPGSVYDPIGLGNSGPANTLNAPWLPAPYNNNYNFNWSQLRIRPGLTFQMDKNNGQGSIVDGVNYRSNVNDVKYLSNPDSTFRGTYSLYIKDDWGSDSGILESWSIEFFYKKSFVPILALTQSDPENMIDKGEAKLQYLFGLEGNQYLFIKGDKVDKILDSGNSSLDNLRASLKNLKIDGGYHSANNQRYLVNDKEYGSNSNPAPSVPASSNTIGSSGNNSIPQGKGGDDTFSVLGVTISNVSYSTYVGTGNLNVPSKLSIGAVSAKIGNGRFMAGIWENGAWNSGWRDDEKMKEFFAVDDFFPYDRNTRWRFSVYGPSHSAGSFEIGDKVSIGNIAAIDINEERKLLKRYFTIISKGIDYITVEFDSSFPIRRIKLDSGKHRIYVTKNVWLNGGFFNGYFRGVWNNGLFQGFPYITKMTDSHWIDGKFKGGHFAASKKSVEFSNTYLATLDRIKVGLLFDNPHGLAYNDEITISSTARTTFGVTKVAKVVDDYRIITAIDWDDTKDSRIVGAISGMIHTKVSTGVMQNLELETDNVSSITSLQSMDSTRVFMYNSWIDVNFDNESAVNIGKPQSTIDTTISTYAYSDNNLYGYPSYDILASDVTFRDSFSNTIRKYRLGSKYKIYEDYIGDAGEFDEHFDVTGWAVRNKMYRKSSFPFFGMMNIGDALSTSTEFDSQGWILNKDSSTGSGISAERTGEAEDDDDVAAGKEIKIEAVGRGGALNIQPAYGVGNRNNSPIAKLRYTMISFDMLASLIPDNVFEESDKVVFDGTAAYQPIVHFNNLNIVTRKQFVQGIGYIQKKFDATYFPVYKNVNHLITSKKNKVEFFYNKRALSMFFRGNGLVGENISSMVIDNLKLYEVDMIPFFQYFDSGNINKSVYIPYQATAPKVGTENEFSQGDASPYGFDSFKITQPSGEVTIQEESAALAAQGGK